MIAKVGTRLRLTSWAGASCRAASTNSVRDTVIQAVQAGQHRVSDGIHDLISTNTHVPQRARNVQGAPAQRVPRQGSP